MARGKAEWARVLGRLAVEGGSEAQKRSFSTALYRTHERMVDINEGGRYYSGYDGKVHERARPFDVDDRIWDIDLAQHPLRTILDPGMESDILSCTPSCTSRAAGCRPSRRCTATTCA